MNPSHNLEDDERSEERPAGDTEQNPPPNSNTTSIPPVTQPNPEHPKDEAYEQVLDQPSPDVLTNNGVGTGWTAMAHNVRDVDEQKVKGHKEDIDTILVFAGLFSAVMTAFLLESYKNLSPDPTQVMIMLMQQVVTQTHSYSVNDGLLNSTAHTLSPTLPDFHPTVNAIRVNVLWFASLTLSLVSASFAILVKQWLREYLAGDYTSPQARLRIRHFRYPGLEHWKVFEIAAALPLLIQLSLALFLVGLCFFTADVHSTVEHTTLPLVAGWAVLFIAVSFAPAFSPRCPYKITLLKSALVGIRMYIYHTFLWVKRLPPPTTDLFSRVSDKWTLMNLAYDEEAATKNDRHNIEILVSVDSIQTDDHHLPIMWEAVKQTIPEPAESLMFIRKVIEHRIQQDISDSAVFSSDYLDLTRLPSRTVLPVLLMANDLLKKEIMRQLGNGPQSQSSVNWSPWMKDCIHLLLSKTSQQLPHVVNETLSLLLNNEVRCKALLKVIVSRIPNPDTLMHVLERFQDVLARQRAPLLTTLSICVEAYFCSDDNHTHNTRWNGYRLPDIVRAHPEITPIQTQFLVSIIVSASLKQFPTSPETWWGWCADRVMCILGLPDRPEYHDDVLKFVQAVLLQRDADKFCREATGLYWYFSYRNHAQELFIKVIVSAEPQESLLIVEKVIDALDWYWNREKESEDTPARREYRLGPLATYHMVLRALKKATEDKGKTSLEDLWTLVRTELWPSVENGMDIVAARLGLYENHPDIARRCLELIDTLDVSPAPDYEDEDAFAAWEATFDENETVAPDACIRLLARFLPGANDIKSYRLRRVRSIDARMKADARALTIHIYSPDDLLLRSESRNDDGRSMDSQTQSIDLDENDPTMPTDTRHFYKVDKFHRVIQT